MSGSRRDRLAFPRLESVAERVQVAVGAHAGVRVRAPGATEVARRFEDGERGAGALLGEVIGSADAGDPGPDHQHVDVFGHGSSLSGSVAGDRGE